MQKRDPRADGPESGEISENPTGAPSHRFTVAGMLQFELKSLIGRYLFTRPPAPGATGPRLLNLGCGANPTQGFVNADFFRFKSRARDFNFWGLDLRYPLPCEDNHWDGIFTEHTLEHLYPDEVGRLLKEIHRTLQPGAWVRIVVPDLAKYVAYYDGQSYDEAFAKWQPRGAALRSVSQGYLHVSLWDAEMLSSCLRTSGFLTIATRAYGVGADPRLLRDTPGRAYESLYIEAQKNPERSTSSQRA